jgi:hypothetical protein
LQLFHPKAAMIARNSKRSLFELDGTLTLQDGPSLHLIDGFAAHSPHG